MQFPPDSPPPNNPYAAPSSMEFELNRGESEFDSAPFHPLKSVWFHPRRTVRRLVAENPTLYVIPLACLSGIGETLDRASMRNAGDTMSLAMILTLAVLLGPLAGILSLWVGAFLIRFVGSWLGGHAEREAIRTAIAWASVPAVCALPLWFLQIGLFGKEMFTEAMPRLEMQPSLWIPLMATAAIEIVLAFWSLVLLCNMIAEVQGFRSAWRGLGNLILAGLAVIVPLIVLAIIVVGLM